MEVTGSFSRTVTWHVDGQLVAVTRSSEDTVRLEPGDRLEKSGSGTDAHAEELPDVGAIGVRFTAVGRPRRVTWYRADGEVSAATRALLGAGGIDLDPEPGSPAALREERIRRHPRRHAAVTVAGGVGKVVVPLLLGLLAVRLATAIPWPDWNLPSIPWPDVDLPSIPWPDVELPDWQVPGWVSWLADKMTYVWPVILAAALARAEIRRRRRQDALKAQLKAEALGDEGPTGSHPDQSRMPGQTDRDPGPTTAG
ncbi:hypothetical protein [Blastococcus sp. VKM Ac-2987]|uniref:hypothetical protein n=1 Tax=Blastococcus sp. VKM Ac-2987 TaxID=3004141 RepID=UPI0022AB5764|nr:hypothetical protein [Blastococcus sp. VKM Ac-2987]MCZ2860699.1 hypothetical protein [Blastococcus sp. VKM Ac-2987]